MDPMMRREPALAAMATAWAIAGCGEPRSTDEPTSVGDPSEMSTSSPVGSGEDSAMSSGVAEEDGSDGMGLKLDVGPPGPDSPPGPAEGCDKIDFLFVIDNSGSMADEQDNLIASFDGFMEAIASTVGIEDVHIMVVDTDGAEEDIWCEGADCCSFYCVVDPAAVCNGIACSGEGGPASACESALGAGRVAAGTGEACGLPEGTRFLAGAAQDLSAAYTCIASVGANGSGNERPVDATRTALLPMMLAPGGCNEGFLRTDALLVVTIISDEDDVVSAGDPAGWHDAVVALKGDPGALVVLGLIGDGDLAMPSCPPFSVTDGSGAMPAPRLRAFVEAFEYGRTSSVCAASYDPFFAMAIAEIADSCENFDPPG